jgi:hypothetical protein
VGKIDVPWMWRHVRTLAHVAHVAQVALIDDVLVLFLRNAVDFPGRSVVDQIEQRWKRAAQADAAPTSVADVEDAREFSVKRLLVLKLGRLPRERMPRGRKQATFGGHKVGPPAPTGPATKTLLDNNRQSTMVSNVF